MNRTLMREILIYRTETEDNAQELIEELTAEAAEKGGELTKKTVELKQKKAKGVVTDENYKVTVQFDYAGQWDESEKGE